MRRRGFRDLLILLLLLVVGGGGTYITVRATRQKPSQLDVSKLQTIPAERGAIQATIGATGNTHARQSAVLTWKTTGRVASVLVNVGDTVEPRQTLASIDPTTLPATVLQAQIDLANAQRALEDLQQSQANRAKAQVTLANAQQALQDALDQQAKLNQTNASPGNIEQAQGKYDQADAALTQAEQIYSLLEGRPGEDIQRLQAASQLERARRMLEYAQWNLTYAQSKPDTQTASLIKAQVQVAQAQVDDAQREWDRLKNGPSQDDITAAQAKIDAAKATLEQAGIVAPFAGTVTALPTKPGDVIKPGTPAVRLEDLSEVHVLVQVPEVDISSVKVDDLTVLTFDAIPNQKYKGIVTNIGQFGQSLQGNVSFEVELRMLDPNSQVKTGMTAAVTITVASVPDTLLIPNRAVRLIKGERVVYVLRNNQLVQTPVTLGITDNVNSQLLTGNIQAGEMIVLNPPAPTPTS